MSPAATTGRLPVFGHPWWEARRLRYNVALILAGVLAEALYVAASVVFAERIAPDEFEVTAFTIVFQGVGYVLALFMANLRYFLGPLGERLVDPTHRSGYRDWAYAAGLVFSVAWLFLWPLSAWLMLWRRTALG